MTNNDFLSKLQSQAQKQSVLSRQSLLPRQLEGLAAIVANYPWQTVLISSILSAISLELLKNF